MRRLYFHCRAFLIRKKMSSTVALTQIGDILCEMVRSISFLSFCIWRKAIRIDAFDFAFVVVSPLAQRLNKIHFLAVFNFCWSACLNAPARFPPSCILVGQPSIDFWKPTTFFQWTVSFKRGVSESRELHGSRDQGATEWICLRLLLV